MVPILLLAAWLGIRGLNADALWYDEWLSVYRAGAAPYGGPPSVSELWDRINAVDNNQSPAYYFALAGWGRLAGLTELGGRSLSLLCGLLAVAWVYRLGRDLGGLRVGIGAGLAIGSSAFFANYLHEMRAYALYVLLTAMAVWAYWRVTYPPGGRQRAGIAPHGLLVVSLVGVLYTHQFGALTVAALGLYHLIFVPKTRRWWTVAVLIGLSGLLYLPLLAHSLTAVDDAVEQGPKSGVMGPRQALEVLASAFSNGSVALGALVGIYAALDARRRWRARQSQGARSSVFVWFAMLSLLVLSLLLNAWLGVLTHPRYLLALWVPLAVIVGFGLDGLARSGVAAVVVGGIWIAAGVASALTPSFITSMPGTFVALPFRELAHALDDHVQDGDVVALHVPDYNWLREPTFQYYMYGLAGRHTLLESIPGLPGGEYQTQVADYLDTAPRVWLAVDKTLPPNFRLDDFEAVLAADAYAHCETVFDLPDMSLDLYARPVTASPLRFGDAIGLALLEPLPETVSGTLTPLLGWTVGVEVPGGRYSFALHVLNAEGVSVAQTDAALPGGGFSCAPQSLSLKKVAPGEYTLVAVVYAWESGERLPGENLDTGATGELIPLGTFSVR